jgi:NADPH:quinone reductase-like Zn-dependent oxidoreductase
MNPGASIIMQLLPFVFRAPHAVPELDFAGTITEVGADVSPERELQVGAEVFGSIPPSQHLKSVSGALAKYVVVDHRCVVKKPVGMKMEEAAGLGVAGCTAVELMKGANLKRGDSVLVNGASGGVGHLVLQMCCAAVAETGRVVAVCSSGNAEWVGRLGAGVEVSCALQWWMGPFRRCVELVRQQA